MRIGIISSDFDRRRDAFVFRYTPLAPKVLISLADHIQEYARRIRVDAFWLG
jgi:hypothetical protein